MTRSALWLCLILTPTLWGDGAAELEPEVHRLLQQRCANCHGPRRAEGGIDFIADLERVAGSLKLVHPGRPQSSELYLQVESQEMPRGRGRKLSSEELGTLRDWIVALGAREDAQRAERIEAARAQQTAEAAALGLEVEDSGPAGITLRLIPHGSFVMGSPAGEVGGWKDQPQQQVRLERSYFLSATEVTQAQWEAVMGSQAGFHTSEGGDRPVESISWFDALEFCNRLSELAGLEPVYLLEQVERGGRRGFDSDALPLHPLDFRALDADRDGLVSFQELGYPAPPVGSISSAQVTVLGDARSGFRLPSEAEWEYACRAGTRTPFWSGWELSAREANFAGSFETYLDTVPVFSRPSAVGSFAANPWGLYDMHGNVAEWCADVFAQGASPAAALRSWRGGGQPSSGSACRAAYRDGASPALCRAFLGLRVARSLPQGD